MRYAYVTNPDADFIIGNKAISRYLGISLKTVSNWRKLHALPVSSLPDGRVATSKNLLDQWLLARGDAVGWMNQSPGPPRKDKTNNQGVAADS